MPSTEFHIRPASPEDVSVILRFIRALAEYEHLEHEVVATEELLRHWLFEQRKAEVLLGETEEGPVAFALFFHNFSTFLGLSLIHISKVFTTGIPRTYSTASLDISSSAS